MSRRYTQYATRAAIPAPRFPLRKYAPSYSPSTRKPPAAPRYGGSSRLPRRTSQATQLTVQHVITQAPGLPGTSPLPQINSDQQKAIRETYRQCLASAAQSGKFMTSLQRQQLLQQVSMEAALQAPNGSQGSSMVLPMQAPGLPSSQNQQLTMDELVFQLRSKLSTGESKSSPKIPSSAISTSAC